MRFYNKINEVICITVHIILHNNFKRLIFNNSIIRIHKCALTIIENGIYYEIVH